MNKFVIRDCPESYQIFPYDPDMENGRTNAGGFDLVRNPEDLAKIQEIVPYPWLRDIIVKMNRPDGLLKSYGCEFVVQQTHAWGYVDFAIRDHAKASQWEAYALILASVEREIYSCYPNQTKWFFGNILLWTSRFQEDGEQARSLPIWKVSIEYRASNQDEAKEMVSTFFCKFEKELISSGRPATPLSE